MKKFMKLIIVLTVLIACGDDANAMTDKLSTFDSSETTEISFDKRKRARRKWNRKHGAPKSRCTKVHRIRVR